MIEFFRLLSSKDILNEGCLYEGTHYDKEAAKILAEICSIETAEKIVDALIKEDWVSIFTHTNWIYKFLKPVARLFVEETKKGKSLDKVIQDNIDLLGQFLIYVKDNQSKKDELYNFFNTAHIKDIEKFQRDLQAERERIDRENKVEVSGNEYDVIKIDSYEQLHEMFGGKWTGDGKSDKAADNTQGTGNTAWCHANNKNMWNTHTKQGKYLFFVAAKKNWKDIPPEKTDGNPKDTYGLSLIAIITTHSGRLLETTLRWNHVNVSNADHVFQTWSELNNACGQDIQKACEEYFNSEDVISPFITKDGVLQRNPAADGEYIQELNLEEVSIPEGIKVLGNGVFANWRNLRKVTIPDSVTKIEYGAFYWCTSLTDIIIPNGVIEIGFDAFRGCKSLTSISIPDSVTSIGQCAFYDCRSLTDITIPEGVIEIGEGTFFHCDSLTHITIPNSVIKIGPEVFYRCSSLTDVKIPDGVTHIGEGAFAFCESLKNVTLPDSVTSIGYEAFSSCISLTNISLPKNMTRIRTSMFVGCSRLTDVTIPDGVTVIGYEAFRYCSRLTNINIPNSVTSIEDNAFCYCNSLTSVTIPDNISNIGDYVFRGCSRLKTINCNNPEIVELIKSQIE